MSCAHNFVLKSGYLHASFLEGEFQCKMQNKRKIMGGGNSSGIMAGVPSVVAKVARVITNTFVGIHQLFLENGWEKRGF